ncbi:MAG: hemin uptake protein HemP [Rugosibacter sp.]|nr:hemin uptake protein HemP [Rugosibacter sp.]
MDSTALFASDSYQEVQIIHAGKIYRLRKTRQDKLILTK